MLMLRRSASFTRIFAHNILYFNGDLPDRPANADRPLSAPGAF